MNKRRKFRSTGTDPSRKLPTAFLRLMSTSNQVAKIEKPVMGLLVAALFGVVLLNLVSRSIGWALYWADELAIYLMIWATFVGASISVKLRTGISVTVMNDSLPAKASRINSAVVDALVWISSVSLLIFSWIWYDPILLLSSGFDITEFKNASFNFIYHEPTLTLQIQKFWVWLIMPLTAATISLHSSANLLQAFYSQPEKASSG